MEQPEASVLPIKQGLVLDILDQQHPALSSTSDMPVIETKPDSTPATVEKAATDEVKTPVEPATTATEEQPGADDDEAEEVKKPPRGVQKRLDELTRQREEAKSLAEAERQEKLRLLAIIEGRQTDKPAKTEIADEPARPVRADFTDENEYIEAFEAYSDQRATNAAKREIQAQIERQNREAQETAIAEGQKKARDSYLGRVEKTQEKYADFKEVAESPDVVVSIPMAHAIVHHEQGPDIQYYLGKNPAEAERIAKLDVPSQLVELGIIVATKLTANTTAETKPDPKPDAKKISAAPKPLSQTKAGETTIVKDPSLMNMDEYAAFRKKGGEARH